MESTAHITLPVSALKTETTRVFEALDEGRTVYVSKHGDVVAAIRPDVPMGITATYALPQVATAEVTARAMGRAAPTGAVNDAVNGLPSLVTREHKVYGVLAAAEMPAAPFDVPDLDAADARSEVMNAYLTAHPDASIEEVADFRETLDAQDGVLPTVDAEVGPFGLTAPDDDEVENVQELWRSRGSEAEIEKVVEQLFTRGLAWVARYRQDIVKRLPVGEPASTTVALRQAAGLLETNPVAARKVYVTALIADPSSERGLAWRLGDLSRTESYLPEASKWYRLALGAGLDSADQVQATPTGRRNSASATKKAVARTSAKRAPTKRAARRRGVA